PAEALQVGVVEHALHQPHAEAAAPVRFEHVDIADVRERRAVGDDAGEADLLTGLLVVEPDAERAADRALDGLAGDALRPVRAGEVGVDRRRVEPGGVVGNGEAVAATNEAHPSRSAIVAMSLSPRPETLT